MTSLFRSVAWIAVLAFGLISLPASAANIPCKTAKLIVPWKAGAGTHVLFSIFERTLWNFGLINALGILFTILFHFKPKG